MAIPTQGAVEAAIAWEDIAGAGITPGTATDAKMNTAESLTGTKRQGRCKNRPFPIDRFTCFYYNEIIQIDS